VRNDSAYILAPSRHQAKPVRFARYTTGPDRPARTPRPDRCARRSGRSADDDVRLELDLLRARPAADAVDQEVGDPRSDAIGRDMNSGQRRVGAGGGIED